MPKIVDRESRRLAIAEAYLRVLGNGGTGAATTRALATELGVATGALWHYFDGLDELSEYSFRLVFDRTSQRIRSALSGLRGLAALDAALHEIVPSRPLTESEAIVVVSFWGRVATNPGLGAVQAQVESEWRSILLAALIEGVEAGEIVADAPLADLVDILLVLSSGIQVEYVLRSDTAASARQEELLQALLLPWLS